MTKSPRNEFEKLVDQDPSAGIEFDQASLIANLKARLPEASLSDSFPRPDETAPQAASSPDTHEIEHPTVVPLRKKGAPAWGQIAASVAVTAVLAGGGVYAATASTTGVPEADSYPAAITASAVPELESPSQPGASPSAAGGEVRNAPNSQRLEGLKPVGDVLNSGKGSPELAAPNGQSVGDESKAMPWGYSGRYTYTAKGLSSEAGTAHAYGFDESGVVNEATFDSVKKAFGIDAPTVKEWGSFTANQGNSTSLGMNGNGLGSIWFYSEQKLDKGESDEAVAVERLRALMTELGLDPAKYTFEAKNEVYYTWNASAEDMAREPSSDATAEAGTEHQVTNVTAHLKDLKAAQYSADTWYATLFNDQIISMNGSLAPMTDLGEYPIVSATQAVDRLSDPRFGTTNVAWPADGPAYIDVAPNGSDQTDGPKAGAKPSAGMSFTWSVSDQVITKAELGLAGFSEPSGTYTMLPVWNLTSEEGLTFTVLAVADSKLEF